jgi:hypothetical protein
MNTLYVNFQQQFSIDVWAGILNGPLTGSYILPHRMNAVPLGIIEHLWLLHVGVPRHNAHIVPNWLNNT